MADFTGTAGNDNLDGTTDDDVFDMTQGGDDNVNGGKGDDVFNFGATLTADDVVNGSKDSADPFHGNRDAVVLDGDYAAGLVLSATTLKGIETMVLNAGNSYDITTNDAMVVAGDIFTVRLAGNWGPGDNLTFDGSAETDGSFRFTGGQGTDTITGGAGVDSFVFARGALSAEDRIDGGAGFDDLTIRGPNPQLFLDADTIQNIEVIYFGGGNSYSLFSHDGNVAAGETLAVSGAFLETGDVMVFNGSDERDGFLNIYGGDADDALTGGRRGDVLQGNAGGDTLEGGRGRDMYAYVGGIEGESTYLAHDTVVGFNFDAKDAFQFTFEITGVDAAITSGAASFETFGEDLKQAADGVLEANHVVLFTPDSGDLAGNTYLLIDANGTAGAQQSDMVILLQDAVNLGSLDAADFII
jgi:Ca2+-binding RTX toxin-like protein